MLVHAGNSIVNDCRLFFLSLNGKQLTFPDPKMSAALISQVTSL